MNIEQPVRVLLVDDDREDYVLTGHLLSEIEGARFRLDWASTYEDALNAIGRREHEVYLLDYNLGGRTGLELLREALAMGCTAPIIMLTGIRDREVDLQAMKAGAVDFLVKDGLSSDMLERSIRYAIERKRVELERARLAAIVESSDDAIIGEDLNCVITSWNKGAEGIFGYKAGEIIGRPISILVPEDRKDEPRKFLRNVLAGKPVVSVETVRVCKDGRAKQVSLTLSPILDGSGKAVGTSKIVRDITKQKRAERNLQRMQARLAKSNEDLLRKNREIHNFYHTLSHELKTPLTSATEFISIVMEGIGGPVTETQMRYLGIARESCGRMKVFINDLLDATRLETGKLSLALEETSLAGLLGRFAAAMQPAADRKNIRLSFHVDENVPGIELDPNRIDQVLTNLVNNAIKFTPEGGAISITASLPPELPGFVSVAVKDSGRGIPREQIDRVFDRLYQVMKSDATAEKGMGLGLYICRELIGLHGGQLFVESTPGEGSAFTFIIPIKLNLENAAQAVDGITVA